MNDIWVTVGIVVLMVVWGGAGGMLLAPRLREMVASVRMRFKYHPARAIVMSLAIGAAIAYGGTKPTPPVTNSYVIAFVTEEESAAEQSPSQSVECGKVANLNSCTYTPPAGKRFTGWRCSNGNRYDDGMLIFNLAQPGETVTMTAIWE